MRVLVVHPYIKIFGGGERVCLQMIKALIEEGNSVSLVCEPVECSALESFLGEKIKDLRCIGMRMMPPHGFKPRIGVFSVYQIMLRNMLWSQWVKGKVENVDIELLTQDVMFSCGIGKKRIAYVHFPANLVHFEKTGPKSGLFWKIYYVLVEAYWKSKIDRVDLFICNSEYTKNAIRERWGKEAIVVHPPVSVDRFEPAPVKENFVVTIGRFVPEKNYETIVEVARLLPHVKFVIVGRKEDAAYYEKIERSKPANLKLLSDLPENEMISQLARAKVYLHAMVGEHFGISIVEAMAAGCIPVIHDSGGAKEATKDSGYVYNTVDECVEAVSQALSSDLDPKTFVDRAQVFNTERFEEQIIEKITLTSMKGAHASQ